MLSQGVTTMSVSTKNTPSSRLPRIGAIGIALFGLFDGKSAKKADNANPKP